MHRKSWRRLSAWLAMLVLAAVVPAGAFAQSPSVAPPAPHTEMADSWRLIAGQDGTPMLPGGDMEPAPAGETACAAACEAKPADRAGWADNLSLFLGLNGSKGPEDLGINANFGLRTDVNWGLPLWEEYGLGVQLGTSLNYSRTAVRVLRSIDGTSDRWENFSTGGLFQRAPCGLNWGLVYDYVDERYYDRLDLGQWRGQVGYNVTDNDEVGVWGAWREHGDAAVVGDAAFSLEPILQGNLFWRHIWRNETVTRVWVGVAEEHGRFVYVAPGESPVHHPFVFGADVFVPLNDYLSLYGEANFITPNDTGTVTASFGFAFYPGGGAHAASRSRFAPYLPLANDTSFALDLRQ